MRTRTAAAVALLALAAAGLGIALTFASDHDDSPLVTALTLAIPGLGFVFAGLVAALRRPDNRTGWWMVMTGAAWLLTALREANEPAVFTIGMLVLLLPLAPFAYLVLAYPTGRLTSRAGQAVVLGVTALASVGHILVLLFDARPFDCDGPCPDNVVLVDANDGLADGIVAVETVAGVALAAVAIAILLRRWRRATAAERRVLLPVYATAAAALIVIAGAVSLEAAFPSSEDVFAPLVVVTLSSVPFAFLLGTLRTRLARTGVGRMLLEVPDEPTTAEAQGGLRRALGDPTLQLGLWHEGTGGFVDADGKPLELPQDRSLRAVKQIGYAGRPIAVLIHDPALRHEPEYLDEVAATVRVALEKDRSLRVLRASERRNRAILEAIPDTIFRLDPEGRYLDVNTPHPEFLVAPADQLIGRTLEEVLPPEVAQCIREAMEGALATGEVQTVEYALPIDGTMHDVEGRVALTGNDELLLIVRNVTERKRQERELKASRARIVEAGDHERRRLERNLHDGAQQRLVALSLAIRLARGRLNENPAESDQLLAAAEQELALALEELRELARGIHPAVLSERGLGPALNGLAARSPVPVDLELEPDRLPGPVEAAAYYVVSEALANVVKYAEASSARIRVARENGRAVVEVADDGVGGADPSTGTGLRGLADRVEALDGRLEVESAPGSGTRIRAVIPLDHGP